jgi:hypothetical protein
MKSQLLFTEYGTCHFHSIVKQRWMRPHFSFFRQQARAPSTREKAMLSVAGTRRRKKSCVIFASSGAISGLL